MTTQTGMRKASQIAAVAALATGVTLVLPAASATAGDHAAASGTVAAGEASDLSPSTRNAWKDFIEGGSEAAGGAARMVSGAWFGAPAIVVAASGGDLSAVQLKAWRNWDEGAEEGGQGVAKVISGAYVGAPGYVIDKITAGATPGDLTPSELRQVSFMMPAGDLPMGGLPTDMLPLGIITDLLGFAPV